MPIYRTRKCVWLMALSLAPAVIIALGTLAIFAPLQGATLAQGQPPTITPYPVPTPTPPPLGNPTGLTAKPGPDIGQVSLNWTPAANATVHWVWSVRGDNTGGKWTLGDTDSAVIAGLEAAQNYWFRVIAGQKMAGETTQWSKWSHWTTAAAEHSFLIPVVCISDVRNPCQMLDALREVDGIDGFGARVKERTNSHVIFNLKSYPKLGLDDADAILLLKNRSLSTAEVYPAHVSGDLAMLEAVNLWGLYPDSATQFAVIDATRNDVRRIIERATDGVVITEHYTDGNFFFSSKELLSPDDFGGLKIRSYRVVLHDLLEGMEALPHFMGFFDVYGILEDRTTDAAVSCGSCGASQRWYEVADYLHGPINGSASVSWIVMNRDLWDSIPSDLQAIIIEEGNRHQEKSRELASTEWTQEAISTNTENGMVHSELSPEIHDAILQAHLNSVLPRWVERAGGPDSEAVRLFNEVVAPIVGVNINPDGSAAEVE